MLLIQNSSSKDSFKKKIVHQNDPSGSLNKNEFDDDFPTLNNEMPSQKTPDNKL